MPEEQLRYVNRRGYCALQPVAMATSWSHITVTEEMIDRAVKWYGEHWSDDMPPRDWHRAYLNAALNP